MRIDLHPKFFADVIAVMEYYEQVASPELADDFYGELRQVMLKAAESPESYSIRERDLHRANLRRFPYHFLYRIADDSVRILVLRHHRRHPNYGLKRR